MILYGAKPGVSACPYQVIIAILPYTKTDQSFPLSETTILTPDWYFGDGFVMNRETNTAAPTLSRMH
jgi:hypothetical protein